MLSVVVSANDGDFIDGAGHLETVDAANGLLVGLFDQERDEIKSKKATLNHFPVSAKVWSNPLPYLADGLLLFDQILVQLDRQTATATRTDGGRCLPVSVVERDKCTTFLHFVWCREIEIVVNI